MQDYQRHDETNMVLSEFDTLWEGISDLQPMVQPLLADDTSAMTKQIWR